MALRRSQRLNRIPWAAVVGRAQASSPGVRARRVAEFARRYASRMATREDLHRRVDALSEAQVERARIIVVDEVVEDSSVDSILARHGEQRLSADEFQGQFGNLPQDGEG
jgi:hypothetical protein